MQRYKNLALNYEGHIAIMSLAREPVNAINYAVISEISAALDELEKRNEIWVLIIKSSLKLFSAGASLDKLESIDSEENKKFSRFFNDVLLKLSKHKNPVICAIDGMAFGGGVELALACDFRVISENAKIALPEVSLGIVTGAAGTQRLSKLIGQAKAKTVMLTGRTLNAREAYDLGIAEYIVENAYAKAIEVANEICKNAPRAVAITKACIDYAASHSIKAGIDYEIEEAAKAFDTEDKKEGIRAFFEKRKAEFKNK